MPNIRDLITAIGTAAAFGGVAVLSVTGWTPFSVDAPAASTVVEPEAVTRNIVCSGSVLAAVADSTTWTRVGTTSQGIVGGHLVNQFTTDGDPDGAIITYDSTPDAVAATEFASVKNDIVAGYMAAECGDPVNSQWLVGGSTTTGRDAVLTISNGSGVDARVDLEFWGANGPITAPAASGLVIGAGESTSYSLAGFAPAEESPVIHVVSNGAPVWATLQTSTVRGLVPGGLDRVVSVDEPATNVVVPVVRQPDEETVGPLRADPDYSDTVTLVRLLVPGETDGNATVTVTPFDGGEPVVVSTALTAGKVLDIPVDELASGDFSVTIDSDVPIVASTRFTAHSTKSSVTDMAWSPAVPARPGPAMAYVPVADSTLSIVNNGDVAATVDVTTNGESTSVSVGAHSSVSVTVGRGALTVVSDTPVVTGVVVETQNGVATLRLPVEPLGARSVTVIAH